MTAAYYTYLPNRTAIEEYLRYLQGLEYDRLREIAAFEGMTIPKRSGPAREQALQALASNLASTPGVNRRLLGVTRRELALLRLLWRRGPEIARAGMTAFFAPVLKRGEIERVLERLTFLLLVLPDNSGRFVVPEAVRAALLGRSGLAHPAATLFGALSSDSLGRICDYLGLQGIKNNKQARLTAVVAAVADEQRTRAAIEALDDEERSLFDLLLQGGGQVDSWSLYQRHPSLFPRSSYGGYLLSLNQARAAANDTTAGMRLQLKGLVVAYPADWASQLVVPDEVLVATQPPAELDPADFTEPALAPPPAEAHPAGMHPSPVLDIVEVLRYVEEARPKPTQKGLMPKPESKRLAR
ncbi:MAG TPA: hypothetical protein VFA70_02065, partial [Dehalococcoidia bacterium]|nr:hypothetical protein [Dehalococcoidia bacterium]